MLRLTESVNANQTTTLNEVSLEFVAQYGYDSYNRRVSKLSLSEETWYSYDGWQLCEEYDLGWSAKTLYFDGGGINEHLGFAVLNGSSWERYAIIQDQQGSVVRVLDAQGQTVARYEYDPYGRRSLVQGTPSLNLAYGFTGAYLDHESGLYYKRNRYYDAQTGRFLTLASCARVVAASIDRRTEGPLPRPCLGRVRSPAPSFGWGAPMGAIFYGNTGG